ncbi:PBP1A family penicillin-binding protein [bacterium]|nr:PBP1A family penicillin-binding protein [bacterium]
MYNFVVPKQIKKAKSRKFRTTLAYFFSICIAIFFAGMVSFKLYLSSLPPINNLAEFRPNIITQFYSSDGEIIKTFTAYTFKKVDLEEIPETLIQAIIATEDKKFYHHSGYDLVGLARSILANIMAGHVVQGASTITQQLSRILFLSNEKTFTRKFKEFIIAARIEKTISKDKILEMYLNNVYLGSGAYGVEGASQIYFNKHLNELSLAEIALIAGLPQAPSVYSPFNDKKKAEQRRNQVLKRMYKMRYITKEQYKKAKEEPIHLSQIPQLYTYNKAPYFCDYVMKELEKLGFNETDISQGGYKIITTLDYKAQVAANESIIRNMNAWGLTNSNQQAAIFSFNTTNGRILAYAGGKDYTQSQFDRVTQAVRPPGSAFKPFVYAAAIEKGLTPNDMVQDLPVKIGNWSPKNYGNKYRGEIPLYTALMVSSNVCAARLIEYVGIRSVIQLARVMGITTPLEYDYTIALGSNGVKLFEMTRAFGIFSNGGYRVEPYAVESIETSRGRIIYTAPKAKATKVMSEETAAAMTAMMKTVIQSGTGVAANIGKPAAAKTGTTDDSKDATFFGYTPDVVTGVWVGNDDNTKMGNLTGGTVPALIWKDVMKAATEPYGNKDFDYPETELKSFKMKGKPVIISPENAQKTFEKEKSKSDDNDQNEVNEVNVNESVNEQNTFVPLKGKQKNKQQETTNNSTATPKIEIKQIKIEQNQPATTETDTKLAPIPMAKPF